MKNKLTTYFYFDDNEETAIGVRDNLEFFGSLSIEVKEELPWNQIIDYLLEHESEFDGLILDWKLDGEDGSTADFASEALAQQCRSLQIEYLKGKKFSKNFPIILCSSQPGFENIFTKDTTSADLFDGVFNKTVLEGQETFLLSLISAYRELSKSAITVENIIGLSNSSQEQVNVDLIKKIEDIKERQPHETVRFILSELINMKGALINEKNLAARLGVDIKSTGWRKLKKIMDAFKYTGILSQCNARWWAGLLNDWWFEKFDGSILKYLTATERIQLLEGKFKDLAGKLSEAPLCLGASNKEFWTICYGSEVPLAEEDGFIVDKHLHYSWQEKEYICLEEAKDETNKDKWKALLPFEEKRLEAYYD